MSGTNSGYKYLVKVGSPYNAVSLVKYAIRGDKYYRLRGDMPPRELTKLEVLELESRLGHTVADATDRAISQMRKEVKSTAEAVRKATQEAESAVAGCASLEMFQKWFASLPPAGGDSIPLIPGEPVSYYDPKNGRTEAFVSEVTNDEHSEYPGYLVLVTPRDINETGDVAVSDQMCHRRQLTVYDLQSKANLANMLSSEWAKSPVVMSLIISSVRSFLGLEPPYDLPNVDPEAAARVVSTWKTMRGM